MARRVIPILNPGEASMLKAKVYDLSEAAAKQLLFGIIQVLSFKNSVARIQFEEILDDAEKYNKIVK